MRIFRRIVAQAEKGAMDRAWKEGRLQCPQCGVKPQMKPVDMDALVRCDSCGHEGLPGEWQPTPGMLRSGDPDRIPAGTRIVRETSAPGETAWHIPASGKFGFFGFFGVLWTTITAVVSGGFLLGGGSGGKEQPWFIYPFFAVFWAIGLGCLYAALRAKFARHRVTAGVDRVTLRREMFGRVKERSLAAGDVTAVEQAVFYQQNYQPVYGIEIRARGGKLRFGTTLADEEKAWLVADIRRAVLGIPVAGGVEAAVISAGVADRQRTFSFPLPPQGKGLWVIGLVLMCGGICGLGFFGYHHFMEDAGSPLGRLFSGAFALVPVVMGAILTVVGATMVRNLRPKRGFETRLEGDEAQISIRDYQDGRLIREQAFPRESVKGARASHSGDVNGQPMKRIDLIVHGRGTRLRSWTPGDLADTWVAEVNRAIGESAGA